MKKLLLATAIAAVASSAYAAEGDFYVRADVGSSWMPKHNEGSFKGKRTNHVVSDLGAGMYLMDNVRTEFTVSHHFNAKQKFKNGNDSFQTKVKATSLNLKALVDVVDYGYGKLFFGAGVGYTQLSAKATPSLTAITTALIFAQYGVLPTTVKAKRKNNVNFLATGGASIDVSEGVILDVAYQYNDFGKTNGFTLNGKNYGTKYHFKSHDLTAGIRVDL